MRSLTIPIAVTLCIVFLLGIADTPTDPPPIPSAHLMLVKNIYRIV